MKYWEVAVDAPIQNSLTYASGEEIERGSLVKVPLGKGNRGVFGTVLQETKKPDLKQTAKIKEVKQVYQDFLPIPSAYLDWIAWLSKYYKHPIGQVAKLLYPPLKDKKHGNVRKTSPIPNVPLQDLVKLNSSQEKIWQDIYQQNHFQVNLIHGVTGSGKTEVYLHLFHEVLKKGGKGVFLVPEISLTPQLLRRFAEVFGDQLAVLHSQLTERERNHQWLSIVEGDKKILLGARSAIFCPLKDLGLIVIDEEHEASYKQEEKLKYNARDAAIVLAKNLDIPVVLGSATPSIESWYNTNIGKYKLHSLEKRHLEKAMPEIAVIDLKKKDKDDLPFWLSPELYEAIETTIKKKEQAALFLNRRGLAPSVVCNSCGVTLECPNCEVALTLHAKSHLHCHYCDYHENYKEECRFCSDGEMIHLGLGTERIENDLKELFPKARLARADRDEITSRADMEAIIESMEDEKVDILIGTQMIAKGLDFKKLSMVSVVLADIGFNLQDFRSNERSFHLLSQVAGRSGRHQTEGKVLIQTYNTKHPVLPYVLTNDYAGFAAEELNFRKELLYPPFSKIIRITCQSTFKKRAKDSIDAIHSWLQKAQSHYELMNDLILMGPAEAPLFKLRGKFRYQLLLKILNKKDIHPVIQQLQKEEKLISTGTKVLIDMDPQQMG